MRNSIIFTATILATTTNAALAGVHGVHGGDIILTVENNAITTNLESTGGPVPTRVFESEFVDLAGFFTTDEPGFDNEIGTFPTGTDIGFVITDAVRQWDGADFDTISPSPISLEFSVLGPVTSPATPGAEVTGFNIPVQGDGGWHKHYDFYLEPPASAGIYLLSLRLTHTGALDDSQEFFIVFNQGMPEQDHEDAIAYIENQVNGNNCPEDINGDGIVDAADLGLLIAAFGQTCN